MVIMTLDPSRHGGNPLENDMAPIEGGRELSRPANDSDMEGAGKPIPVPSQDVPDDGAPLWKSAALARSQRGRVRVPAFLGDEDAYAVVPANEPADRMTIDGEFTVVEDEPKKKGFFTRAYNKVASKIPPKEVLLDKNMWKERGKDALTGAAISGALRYGIIGAGTAVGITGVPIVLAGTFVAAVGRTAWMVQKERKAYMAQSGENISFWARATKDAERDEAGKKLGQSNLSKYRNMLLGSTIFSGIGAGFFTYILPNIEPVMGPIFNKIAQIPAVSAAVGFIAGKWNEWTGGGTPSLPTSAGETVKAAPAVPAAPAASDTVIQSRIDQAFGDLPRQTPGKSADEIMRMIEQAHNPVTPTPSLVDAPMPVLSVTDKISALVQDQHLSRRWQAIAENAINGNAQAQKDIAKAILNGTNGFDKNPVQAAEIYRAAADAGNMQAKVDLAYMQFHGLGGIEADPKAAAAALREHAGNNKYARSMLQNLTGEGVARRAASATVERAANGAVVMAVPASAPITVSELPAAMPASTMISAPGQIPDGAKLQVTWTQNAEGVIEGVVKNAPEWLKDGMQVTVPVARVQ